MAISPDPVRASADDKPRSSFSSHLHAGADNTEAGAGAGGSSPSSGSSSTSTSRRPSLTPTQASVSQFGQALHVTLANGAGHVNGSGNGYRRGSAGTAVDEYGEDIDEEMEMQEADRLIRDVEAKEAASSAAAASALGSGDGRRSGYASGQQQEGVKIPAWLIIPVWPVFMTFYHMIVATIGTRILQRLPFERLKPRPINMDWTLFSQTILPLSALFSASLILSNMAYVHLSVSFVQMLKAFIPILTLVIQLICGLTALLDTWNELQEGKADGREYSTFLLSIVALTASGCIIAAAGELRFSLFGFMCQVSAVVVESIRLVLMQVILRNYKLDPLSSIAMYAPVCVVLIGFCLPFMEGMAPFENLHKVGWGLLLANGLLAFMLNVVGMFLIDSAGSLVLTLSGVLKDVLLISVAWLMGSFITMIQVVGYSIALSGLLLFKVTGGSSTSPAGQQVMRVLHAVTDAPRHYLCAPRLNSRIAMTLAAGIIMLGIGSSECHYDNYGLLSFAEQPLLLLSRRRAAVLCYRGEGWTLMEQYTSHITQNTGIDYIGPGAQGQIIPGVWKLVSSGWTSQSLGARHALWSGKTHTL